MPKKRALKNPVVVLSVQDVTRNKSYLNSLTGLCTASGKLYYIINNKKVQAAKVEAMYPTTLIHLNRKGSNPDTTKVPR